MSTNPMPTLVENQRLVAVDVTFKPNSSRNHPLMRAIAFMILQDTDVQKVEIMEGPQLLQVTQYNYTWWVIEELRRSLAVVVTFRDPTVISVILRQWQVALSQMQVQHPQAVNSITIMINNPADLGPATALRNGATRSTHGLEIMLRPSSIDAGLLPGWQSVDVEPVGMARRPAGL